MYKVHGVGVAYSFNRHVQGHGVGARFHPERYFLTSLCAIRFFDIWLTGIRNAEKAEFQATSYPSSVTAEPLLAIPAAVVRL
jgi:hypothetical protein